MGHGTALRIVVINLCVFSTICSVAQDRATKVLQDRERFVDDVRWIYNRLDDGIKEAQASGKPLLVVFRCIPCEACSQFDKKVIEEQGGIDDVLDQFVCVRIVKANGLDLNQFQFDYDQSFHAIMMNADRVIYGRFGTRSPRPEEEDMSIKGFRAALEGALDLHANYPQNRELLAAKIQPEGFVNVPEEFASLKGKYDTELDYEGNVVQSCIHCHQIRDEQRSAFRNQDQEIPDQVLFPYPLPDVIGLRMDPETMGTIAHVERGSVAANAGLRAGDQIEQFGGQPILSTADLQWVLHNADDPAELELVVQRDNAQKEFTLKLNKSWRRMCDISWRATTWDLRRMATGGMFLKDLDDEQRRERKINENELGLIAQHVGEYGEHAVAKNAGFQKGDILIAVDGKKSRMSESELIAYTISRAKGSKIKCEVQRGDQRLTLTFATQ